MDLRSRSRWNPKRGKASVGGDSGGDLISGLGDDLLLRILDLVPDAQSVVRTHALSRRWRGLWTGVAALRFDFNSNSNSSTRRRSRRSQHAAAAERYIAFVNGALALRAAAAEEEPSSSASVEHLAILFDISSHETEQLVPLSVEAAQGWIRYAVRHAVKSFVLKLSLPWRRDDMDGDAIDVDFHPVLTLDEMGNYAKMESLHLGLDGAQLLLPSSSSTVVFPSLVDLSLEGIHVPAGGGSLLSRIVSSACCPRLRKLCLCRLVFQFSMMGEMLRIEADTLLELSLEAVLDLQSLELRTPCLQVLHIQYCYHLNGFAVSAPRLKNLSFWVRQPLHIDGLLSSVGALKIEMFSHGEAYNENRNDGSIHLLQFCRLTRCLEVSFEIPKTEEQTVDIIKGRIPPLPYVTHLTVHIKLRELHSIGPGVACLLAQCINIKYLSLRLCYILAKMNPSELDLLCDNNSCHWKSHEFSLLAHLQEVEFMRLMGTDCEFQFIQSILTKATGIQKVTISFNQIYWRKGSKRAFMLMPPLDGGLWTTCKDTGLTYKWRRCL